MRRQDAGRRFEEIWYQIHPAFETDYFTAAKRIASHLQWNRMTRKCENPRGKDPVWLRNCIIKEP